jgi:hypothetical protein
MKSQHLETQLSYTGQQNNRVWFGSAIIFLDLIGKLYINYHMSL